MHLCVLTFLSIVGKEEKVTIIYKNHTCQSSASRPFLCKMDIFIVAGYNGKELKKYSLNACKSVLFKVMALVKIASSH
jgi:hypothetical protein